MIDPLHDSGDLSPLIENMFGDLPDIDWQHLPHLEEEINHVMRDELVRQAGDIDSSPNLSPNTSLLKSAMRSSDDHTSLSTAMIPVENYVVNDVETKTDVFDHESKENEKHVSSKKQVATPTSIAKVGKYKVLQDETGKHHASFEDPKQDKEQIAPPVLTAKVGRYKVFQAMIYHHRHKYNGNLQSPFVLPDLYAEYPEVKKIVQDGHSAIQNTLRNKGYLSQPNEERGTGKYWLTRNGIEFAKNQGW